MLYDNGYGVPQDYGQARYWWEKAAAQGHAKSQFNLGVLYDSGYYVPQNFVQAHKLYSLAAANGDKNAATLRDALAEQMPPQNRRGATAGAGVEADQELRDHA